jgi:hypothetical protein
MGPKVSGNIWKWTVSMAQLVLQSRSFLKHYVTCILREITWLQGSLKGYKLKRRINGRIICRNRGCIWDLSKFPVVTSMGIALCIFCETRYGIQLLRSVEQLAVSATLTHNKACSSFKLKWTLPRGPWKLHGLHWSKLNKFERKLLAIRHEALFGTLFTIIRRNRKTGKSDY